MSDTKLSGAPKTRFSQFSLDYTRLLKDDYVHSKLLTFKYAGKGKDFIVNGKASVNPKKAGPEKAFASNTSGEAKFIQKVYGANVETKVDTKGLLRVWTNFGKLNLWKPINLFAKVKTNESFDRFSTSLHGAFKNDCFEAEGRLEIKNGLIPCFNEKLVYNHNKNFRLGYVSKLNLEDFNFMRYNAFAQYKNDTVDFSLEHQSVNSKEMTIGKFIFAATYKLRTANAIMRLSYRPQKTERQFRGVAGFTAKLNDDFNVRAKIDSNTKVQLAAKYNINKNIALTVSTGGILKDPKTFTSGAYIPVPVGFQFDFSSN